MPRRTSSRRRDRPALPCTVSRRASVPSWCQPCLNLHRKRVSEHEDRVPRQQTLLLPVCVSRTSLPPLSSRDPSVSSTRERHPNENTTARREHGQSNTQADDCQCNRKAARVSEAGASQACPWTEAIPPNRDIAWRRVAYHCHDEASIRMKAGRHKSALPVLTQPCCNSDACGTSGLIGERARHMRRRRFFSSGVQRAYASKRREHSRARGYLHGDCLRRVP